MASLSRPAPNGRFIKGFSQFVKAAPARRADPQDLAPFYENLMAALSSYPNGGH